MVCSSSHSPEAVVGEAAAALAATDVEVELRPGTLQLLGVELADGRRRVAASVKHSFVLRVSCCNDGAAEEVWVAPAEGKVFDEAGNAATTREVLAGSFVPPGTSPAKDDRVSGSAESIIGVGGSDAVAALEEDPEATGWSFYLLVIGLGAAAAPALLLPDSVLRVP